jgi:branched-chain amino acid transport system substrate-binding protein
LSRKYVVLGVLVAAVVLSACGSSSKKSSSSTAGGSVSAPAKVKGPSGAAIKIGFICSCSGAQASQLAGQSKVATAWADSVNAAGGINGHAVSLTTLDDGGNPALGVQDAKKLVEQDHVIAIVGQFSLTDASWASYVAAKGIPVVGGISPDAPYLTNPDFYPSGSQLVAQTIGTFTLAKAAKKTHLGVLYCAESPICAQLVPLATGAGALLGLKVTTGKVAAATPSYAASCLGFKSAGVDALFVGDASPVVVRVTDQCAQQGYKPQTVSQTSTVTTAWLNDPNLNGALLSGFNANPYDSSTPATAAFRDAMNKFDPGYLSSSQFSYDAIGVWAGGKLFEAAAKAANIGPSSTGADVKKGLYALKNETLGGLTGPLNFTSGKPAFVPCWFTQMVKGGTIASLNGNNPSCLTAAQSAALAKALHL